MALSTFKSCAECFRWCLVLLIETHYEVDEVMRLSL